MVHMWVDRLEKHNKAHAVATKYDLILFVYIDCKRISRQSAIFYYTYNWIESRFFSASADYFMRVKIKHRPSRDNLTIYRRVVLATSLLNGLESERPLQGITRSMTLFYLGNHIRSACRVLKSPRAIPRWRVDLDLCAVTAAAVNRRRETRLASCYPVAVREEMRRDFFGERCISVATKYLKFYTRFRSEREVNFAILPRQDLKYIPISRKAKVF